MAYRGQLSRSDGLAAGVWEGGYNQSHHGAPERPMVGGGKGVAAILREGAEAIKGPATALMRLNRGSNRLWEGAGTCPEAAALVTRSSSASPPESQHLCAC